MHQQLLGAVLAIAIFSCASTDTDVEAPQSEWRLESLGHPNEKARVLAAAQEAVLAADKLVPTELFEVVKVVDGDTIHIMRDGKKEKLRLLSVDTEEKLTGRAFDPWKPETVFGDETMVWAQELFASLAPPGENPRCGLRFPNGVEAYDIYGRLLCHVILPDGTDFNVELVRLGKSPYFNKYGNSLIAPEAFVAAQDEARRKQLGIWNPETNRPAAPDAPAAKRDYERLLPWWECRAQAVDAYRAAKAATPGKVAAADEPDTLEAAVGAGVVEVFGTPQEFFEEDDGSFTALMRSGDKRRSLRVRLSKAARERVATSLLTDRVEAECQNYLWIRGEIVRGPRGFELWVEDPEAIRPAGPEPEYHQG